MLNFIIDQLKDARMTSDAIRRAKGKYKFPSTLKEFKNYVRTRL